MRILIQETQEIKRLSIIDPETGINHVRDFLATWNGLAQFQWDEARWAYICSQAVYDWWKRVINLHILLINRINYLTRQYGSDAVAAALEDVRSSSNPDVYLRTMLAALEKAFPA